MDIVEKLWKEYKKKTQKVKAMSISLSLLQKQEKKVRTSKKEGKEATEQAKSSTSEASKSLQQTVKGQFGKKVTEVLDNQKKSLDHF